MYTNKGNESIERKIEIPKQQTDGQKGKEGTQRFERIEKDSRTSERKDIYERADRLSVPATKDSTYIQKVILDSTPVATFDADDCDVPQV